MASEESPASEGNTNNQTASENIYDIFGTSLETTEIDEKDSWVEICHGCLRFFFSFFLFLFVLGTALISRLTFHIILINLNPPTIFTTMNKFGGDTGNTTAPFLPAQVHISWIWACFLVLVAPSVHSLVYHTGQFCRKKDSKRDDTDENKQKIGCLTLFSNAARVGPSTTNSQKRNTRTVESQTNQCNINITIKLQWAIIIALGIVQAICETIAVFVILPTFDQATASIIVVFMTLLTPTLLNGFINPYFFCPKKLDSSCMQTTLRSISLGLYALTLGLLIFLLYLVSTKENEASPAKTLGITASMLLLLSVGFWENLSGFHIERLDKRTLLMILLSLIKLIIMFVTLLFTFLVMGGFDGVSVLFNGISNAKITLLDKNILLVNTLPFSGDCSFLQPMMTSLTSLLASYGCYKLSYYACRTYLQYQSFSLPLIINLLAMPVAVYFIIDPDNCYANIYNCSIISKEWDFIVDKGNTSGETLIMILVCGVLTFCQVLLLTTYIWRSGLRIAKLEKMFAMPFYAGYAVDITLLWSRRRNIELEMYNTKSEEKTTSNTVTETSTASQNTEAKKQVKMIPFIYLCATMWHETELEMKTLLKSIFRLNTYQFKRTNKQNALMRNKKKKHPEETYFQFEAHVFFDDAFKENKEKVKTEESNANKKFKKVRGKEVNEFVKQFIKCVEETARSYYNIKDFKCTDKFTTPYGARLEWDLTSPSEIRDVEKILAVPCRLILHLKDKFLIRNKKRWSQVMYMYYLLSFIPTAKKTSFLNSMRIDKEQPSTSSKHDIVKSEKANFETEIAPKTFILALDGDVDFKPDAVLRLLERMLKNPDVGAACGRIIPVGGGPVVWYQSFEYAVSHWLQKATEHVFGCVLCSPGCFSLFRASALMSNDVIKIYTRNPTSGLECIQFDQGEDRWLSTLLLDKGFKLEYTAASDAYTYVPEGFFEFFNQRRRWSPSTLANIYKIITNSSSVSKANPYITRLYLLYHTFLFVSSFITPGTIFLMILGATYLAFPEIPIWIAFVTNLLLVSIVMLSCVFAEQKTQLNIIAVISSIYALMMIVVLFGLIMDAIRSGFCSVTTYFFFYVAGIFFLAAVLHPREFINIIHGALYFLAVPTTSMLMLIYALGNLHVTSWGTRESSKIKKRKNQAVDDSLDFCSCFGLWRCIWMSPKLKGKTISKGSHKKNLPPLITSVFEAEYFVPVSHSYPFSLHCKAENGIISYKWFKNNSKIQTTDQVVVNESSGDITFRKITKDCFGTYHCLAENQHGASVSLFVNVKEAALGVFLGRTNETIKCKMFHHCKILCSNRPNCEPSKECKIEWKIGMGTNNPVKTSKKIAIDGRGDLHFLNIERSDEGPNYSCGIWNEKIQRLSKGTTYTVEIIGSNATNELKGIWRNTPKAVLGESATLQCIFSGSSVPNIQWLNTNGSLIEPNSKYKIEQYGRELLIRNVTFDDEGEYACVANSTLPMNPYLNVTTPPIFADTGSRFMMKVIQLTHGEETEIQCHTISAPNESEPVVIQWMKNGRNINKDSSHRFSEENKKLYVSITEDGGCYTCVTENSEGTAVANFILPPKHSDQRLMYAVITVCSTIMAIVFTMGVIVLIKRVRRERDIIYTSNNEQVNEEDNERYTYIEDPVYSNSHNELSENEYSSHCYEEVSCDTPKRMKVDDNPYTLVD